MTTPAEQAVLDLDYSASSITLPDGELNQDHDFYVAANAQKDVQSDANVMLQQSADTCSIVGSLQKLVDDIAAASARVAGAAIQTAYDAIAKVTKKVNDRYNEVKNKVTGAVNAKVKELQDKLRDAINSDDSTLRDKYRSAIETIKNVVNSISSFFQTVATTVRDAVNKVTAAVNAITDKLVEVVNTVSQALCEGTASVLGSVGSGIGGAADSLAGRLSAGREPLDAVKDIHSSNAKSITDTQAVETDAEANKVYSRETEIDTEIPTFLDELDVAIA